MTDSIVSIYQDVKLSLIESGVPTIVQVKQFDHLSRKIRCTLYEDEKEYSIPADIIIAYSGRRPDGRLFQYSSEAVANDRISVEDNKLIITIADFMTEVPGCCPIDIVFMDSTRAILSAFSFILYVEKSAVPEKSLLTATYADVLESILNGLSGCFITDDGYFGIASKDGVTVREGDHSDAVDRVKSMLVECSIDDNGCINYQTDGLLGLSYDMDEDGRLIVYYLEE